MYSWIKLSRLPIKPGKKIKLLNKFGSPEKVLKFLNRQREPELFKFIDKFNTPEEDLDLMYAELLQAVIDQGCVEVDPCTRIYNKLNGGLNNDGFKKAIN